MEKFFSDADVVHRYTRGQAIEDGVLVDMTEWASTREMMGGFRIPVAMTAAVWALVQAPADSHEDTRGRAHDVLWMSSLAARKRPDDSSVSFSVLIDAEVVEMILHVGPGDEGEPVATIMLPGED
ncbi:MAG: DUF6573 family protein [Patescibacteria group bacterium]